MLNKKLVVDTNVLLSDGSALKKLGQVEINIPFIVLQELDKHKTSPGEVGLNARTVIKSLDQLRTEGDLRKGVLNKEGALIRILPEQDKELTPDDQIIAAASEIKDVLILSNDINLRVKASLKGISAEGYSGNGVDLDEVDSFTGVSELIVEPEVIDQLHANGTIYIPECEQYHPNEYIKFSDAYNKKHTAVGRVVDDVTIQKLKNIKSVFGLQPKNLEQSCALDLLLDIDIPLVSLMGLAGSGKTLISLAAALELVMNRQDYQKIVIMRPPIPMGKDIGYLPGGLEEKMRVWMGPIIDNFEMLMGDNNKFSLDYLLHSGLVEIAPPTFIRGRSIAHSVLLVDEVQSLTTHEIKTIVSRLHESSKLIMTGDVRQIDNPKLSAADNGFSKLVEVFKPYDLAGHITLTKCERGTLAQLAAELL